MVIGIIAILASVVVAGATSALNAAKRTKASNIADQIQTAINAYYTEYSVYPVTSSNSSAGSGDMYYDDGPDTSQQGLIFALCGNINPTNGQQGTSSTTDVPNVRQIAFLTPRRTDVDTNGILLNPFNPTSDPYFYIAMDSDYSGVVGDSGTAKGVMPDFTQWKTGTAEAAATTLQNGATQGVAVWCDCDAASLPPKEAGSKAPNFWIHTY